MQCEMALDMPVEKLAAAAFCKEYRHGDTNPLCMSYSTQINKSAENNELIKTAQKLGYLPESICTHPPVWEIVGGKDGGPLSSLWPLVCSR